MKEDYICIASQVSLLYFTYYVGGHMAFLYVFFSAIMGTGLHISAVHFIAEHYQLTAETSYVNDANKGMDTFSYYGPINWVLFNGGYHIEHHDFIRVPCSRLPQVKAMAPEFYDNLP